MMSGLRRNLTRRRYLVTCVAAATMLAMAGCGSGSSADVGDVKADTAAANALVAMYSEPMTSFNLPALTKAPEPGKKIAIVVNNYPESGSIKDGAVEAAKVLGWTAIPIVYDAASPTGVTDAFTQAVDAAPDGVMTNGTNTTDYSAAAKALAEKNIPLVTSNTTDPIAAPVVANVVDGEQYKLAGKILAAYVIAQQGDKASVAMFNIPSFPILAVYEEAFKAEYLTLCPNCPYESIPLQPGDIGTKVPTQVVSAIQRTPSINFAAMGFGTVASGVSAALASAGLNDTKVIGVQPGAANIAAVSKGTEDMWVASPITGMGWKAMDAFARQFNGESVEPATEAELPYVIVTKANADQNMPQAEVNGGDYTSIFSKLWLLN